MKASTVPYFFPKSRERQFVPTKTVKYKEFLLMNKAHEGIKAAFAWTNSFAFYIPDCYLIYFITLYSLPQIRFDLHLIFPSFKSESSFECSHQSHRSEIAITHIFIYRENWKHYLTADGNFGNLIIQSPVTDGTIFGVLSPIQRWRFIPFPHPSWNSPNTLFLCRKKF